MIKIFDVKDKNNNARQPKYTAPLSDKAVYRKELMKEEYIQLFFSTTGLVDFTRGDFIDTEFGRFEMVDTPFPVINKTTGGYDYDLRFDDQTARWKNYVLFYDRQGRKEKAWNLTREPQSFLDIIASNLVSLGFLTYRYSVSELYNIHADVEIKAKQLSFDAANIFDALTTVAQAWGTEWWFDGQIIHLGKCEYGSEFTLDNDVLAEMTRSNGQSSGYATRIYAFGSTRNIPAGYRSSEESAVVEGVVQKRLMLPVGTEYIDAWPDMRKEDIVEAVVAFDEVYPRTKGTISEVTGTTVTDKVEVEDGTISEEEWTAWRFKDTDLKFSEEYILPGQELRMTFRSGALNGMDFAVRFNPDSEDESTDEAQVFEIVRNDNYGINLPNDSMKPSSRDTYVLYGFDTQYVGDNLVKKAEEELLEAARKYMEKSKSDSSVYNCTVNPVRCAGYINGQYDKRKEVDLQVGQKVKLLNPDLSGKERSSRIFGFEKRLDNKFQATYIVGESAQYSRLGALESKIEELTYKGQTFTGNGGSGIYVISRFDNTVPSDKNVFSAQRSLQEFLSKKDGGTAQKLIRFLEGIDINYFKQGETGAHIDGEGNAEFLTVVIRELLRSTRFTDGMFGEGFQLWMDELTGLSNLTVDKVTIRQSLVAMELLIEKVRSVGGQFVISAANGKIKTVTRKDNNYIIAFEQDNTFVAGDLVRCAVLSGTYPRGYWVKVAGVDNNSIIVPVNEFEGAEPLPGDECVLMGNAQNKLRQNLISISATEDGQPRIDVMNGIGGKNFKDCLRVRLGNLDGIKDDRFPLDNQPHGSGLYGDNVYLTGTFVLATGEDILTKFQIVEGKMESAIEGLRTDFTSDKSYLDNASFGEGMNKWDTENEATFFLLGNRWIWANDAPLSHKRNYACVRKDDGRTTVFIKNKYIQQKHEYFRSLPEYKDKNHAGEKKPEAVYLSFFYKCTKAGRLKVSFENSDKTGFEDFEMFSIDEQITETDNYVTFNRSGLWNGTGDFKLSFTGDIYLYMLILSTDRAEALAYKYKTLFEQSEKLIKIAAGNFDKDGNVLEGSSIITTAKGIELFASKDLEDGNTLISVINVAAGNTTIRADKINLEGAVTFNSLNSSLQNTINNKAETNDLGQLAYNDRIEESMLGSTIVVGGYLNTDYIKVKRLDAEGAKVGGFTIENGSLHWKKEDDFNFDDRYVRMGIPKDNNSGMIEARYGSGVTGRFGIKVMGFAGAGAGIYSSTSIRPKTPSGSNVYAGFFDGNVHVNGRSDSVACTAEAFEVVISRDANGQPNEVAQGISFGYDRDLDKIRIEVKNGIIVGVEKE